MMDPIALCGDFRAPKFILCDKCGKRGHRVNECRKYFFSPPTHLININS